VRGGPDTPIVKLHILVEAEVFEDLRSLRLGQSAEIELVVIVLE
jgi:hypothetical protein